MGQRSSSVQDAQEFCDRVAGYWWERITPDEPSALSFVEIRRDPYTNTLKMSGAAFGKAGGKSEAHWESVASCIHLGDRKVFYYWKGSHELHPNEPYEGFGETSFDDPPGIGSGFYSDSNLTDVKSTTKKNCAWRRCDEAEVRLYRENGLTSEVIGKILKSIS